LLDPLITSGQVNGIAISTIAISIALIGLGALLTTFTKGNIPGTDPNSAAYEKP
jgi:hypothetical protein